MKDKKVAQNVGSGVLTASETTKGNGLDGINIKEEADNSIVQNITHGVDIYGTKAIRTARKSLKVPKGYVFIRQKISIQKDEEINTGVWVQDEGIRVNKIHGYFGRFDDEGILDSPFGTKKVRGVPCIVNDRIDLIYSVY